MRVYRFEQRQKVWDWDTIDKEVFRYQGVFSGEHITYTLDANYKTHGCTLYEYKEKQYRFACRTIDKIIEYFGSDFARLLDKDDVVLVEYEVKREHCTFSDKRIELVFQADKIISRTVIHGNEVICK